MLEENCIFCKIIHGDLPSETIFQDELVTAFRDINPAAPVHILIIPNTHIASMNELSSEYQEISARLLSVVPEIADSEGITESGYRLIINTGDDGRQEVPHLHLHLIGGSRMKHPMG